MGYTWFRAESAAVDHPKVMELATVLNAPIALADGYLFRLWSWTHRYAPTGVFAARAVLQLEQYIGREGVIAAMQSVGLVDAQGDALEVHDWSEMQGSLVEKSKRDARMKRGKRRANGARSARAAFQNGARAAPAPTNQPTGPTDTTDRTNPPPPTPRGGGGKNIVPDALTLDDLATWNHLQQVRAEAELAREAYVPPRFQEFMATVRSEGIEDDRLEHAFIQYLRDDDFRVKRWPTAVFIVDNVWRARLPL